MHWKDNLNIDNLVGLNINMLQNMEIINIQRWLFLKEIDW